MQNNSLKQQGGGFGGTGRGTQACGRTGPMCTQWVVYRIGRIYKGSDEKRKDREKKKNHGTMRPGRDFVDLSMSQNVKREGQDLGGGM